MTPLDDVTVAFPGGTCGLIGPNGAGKTTFFNVLSGFVRPAGGTIRCFGEDLLAMTDFRRARWGLRRTFQTEQAIEKLSVFDNVAHDPRALGREARDAQADVLAAIEFVGLDVSPRARSVSSAPARAGSWRWRALSSASRASSSSTSRRQVSRRRDGHMGRLIRRIPEQFGALVVLVDHDMSLVQACCETTAVLDFGKLIASGPTAEVLRDENVIRAYLGTEEVE